MIAASRERLIGLGYVTGLALAKVDSPPAGLTARNARNLTASDSPSAPHLERPLNTAASPGSG
jgi:hypothetical protein